jgi:DNA-binding Xre family transcriptional regulator
VGFIEGVEILLLKRKTNKSELARRLGDSPQNLGKKFKRGTLKDDDLKQIAAALGCDFYYTFIDRETGEEVHRGKL